MDDGIALELENVTVDVGGAAYIRDVSLRVPTGQIHGLLGPNGAGKTSLLRVLYRADQPSEGRIFAHGRDISRYSHTQWARKVGALVQGTGLLAGLTPSDIVEIGLAMHHLPHADMAARRDEALDLVGLLDKRFQSAAHLSGGELQRCYFAQLLACDPEIYILDEPTNHLDLHYQLMLLDEVQRRGRTVLMSLHDLNMAVRYCDCIYVMQNGRIDAQGAPLQVLSRENLIEYYKVDGEFQANALSITGPVAKPRIAGYGRAFLKS